MCRASVAPSCWTVDRRLKPLGRHGRTPRRRFRRCAARTSSVGGVGRKAAVLRDATGPRESGVFDAPPRGAIRPNRFRASIRRDGPRQGTSIQASRLEIATVPDTHGGRAVARQLRAPSRASRQHGERCPRYSVMLRWRFRNRLSWHWSWRQACPPKSRKSDDRRVRSSHKSIRQKSLATEVHHEYFSPRAMPGPIFRRPLPRMAIGRADWTQMRL